MVVVARLKCSLQVVEAVLHSIFTRKRSCLNRWLVGAEGVEKFRRSRIKVWPQLWIPREHN